MRAARYGNRTKKIFVTHKGNFAGEIANAFLQRKSQYFDINDICYEYN